MTVVSCRNTDCIHCDMTDFHCTKSYITIGEDFDCGCNDCENYYNLPDYRAIYWKCVETKSGELGRALCFGKRIEYRGIAFYTQDRITEDGDYMLTHAETGYSAGKYKHLEQRFDGICEKAKDLPSVETLPRAELDNGEWILKEVSENDR